MGSTSKLLIIGVAALGAVSVKLAGEVLPKAGPAAVTTGAAVRGARVAAGQAILSESQLLDVIGGVGSASGSAPLSPGQSQASLHEADSRANLSLEPELPSFDPEPQLPFGESEVQQSVGLADEAEMRALEQWRQQQLQLQAEQLHLQQQIGVVNRGAPGS